MQKYLALLIHLFFIIVLLLFAYVQLNDPDPLLWATFYCICAIPPLLASMKQYSKWLNGAIFVYAIVMMGAYFSGLIEYLAVYDQEPLMQSMNLEKPYIEEAREFIGAGIAAVIVLIYLVLSFFEQIKYKKAIKSGS